MSSSIVIGSEVFEKKIFEGSFFTIYGHGGHLGHLTWFIYLYISYPVIQMLLYNLTLIGQAVSERKKSLNIMVIFMYTAPDWGQTNP